MAKLNKSTSTSKKSKKLGAGYSTTNRKGETTYYKSSKDAPGFSDTFEGKGTMSKGNAPIAQYDASGKVITSKDLGATPLKLPNAPVVDPLKGVTDMNNASLGGLNFDATKKQFTTPPTGDNSFDNLKSLLGANAEAFSDVPTQESLVKEQQKMLKPKEDLANSLQGQLNTITSSRDAEMLRLEGQGRGQTSGFVGGEQARISREATIQAMPIQAQLAIAQSDLESARSYASQLFQAKSQDALARYNYQKELNGTIFNYLNESEKRRLAQVEREQDRAFQVERDNRNSLETLANFAIDNRQSALSAEIMRIDPSSPTYREDVAKVRARLQKYVAPTGPVKRDTGFDPQGNLIDLQTGAVIKASSSGGGIDQQLQTVISNADPFSTKSALSSLLSGSSIAPATKARISPSLAVLNSIDDLANSNLEGAFTGIGGFGKIKEGIKGFFNMKSTEATNNEQSIDAINLKVQQWASGASLTAQQTEQVKNFTPTKWDSDKQVRAKANGLYNFMLKQTESELLTEGINVNFPTINLFEIRDLYEKASPDQRKFIEETYFNK
jgi:hypothetical protein